MKAFSMSGAKATGWYLKRISTSDISESNDGPAVAGLVDLADAS